MLGNRTIGVVVPAFNEEEQIKLVIETMPDFVDRIIIVNDLSKDNTAAVVKKYIDKDPNDYSNPKIALQWIIPDLYNEAEIVTQDESEKEKQFFTPQKIENKSPEKNRIILISHTKNTGVGSAIASGYKWCKDNNIDCTAVMAGDGQMDPSELESICLPVITEDIDYVKGNRLRHRSARFVIPKKRYFGNSVLSIMTKISSGYWRVSDTQTGYTAISARALKIIELHKIYKRYGMPNDMLIKLNIASCTLREVPIKPVYRVGEKSKMKIGRLIPKIIHLLFKGFFKRMWNKYVLRDFHPLALLYFSGLALLIFNVHYILKIVKFAFSPEAIPENFLIKFMFVTIMGIQFVLFAMWMDIQDNERLYK